MTPQYTNELTPRDRIVQYAFSAFWERGIKDVTMDGIAHGLQMSKRTLYQIFADKEELVIACLEHMHAQGRAYDDHLRRETDNVLEIMLRHIEHHLIEMRGCCHCFFLDVERYPRVQAYMDQTHREKCLEGQMFFEEGVRQGYFLPHLDYLLILKTIFAQFRNLVNDADFTSYTIEQCFQNLCFVTIRGCATIEGIRQIDDFMEHYYRKCGKSKSAADQA